MGMGQLMLLLPRHQMRQPGQQMRQPLAGGRDGEAHASAGNGTHTYGNVEVLDVENGWSVRWKAHTRGFGASLSQTEMQLQQGSCCRKLGSTR
jgi:hypothetical protein